MSDEYKFILRWINARDNAQVWGNANKFEEFNPFLTHQCILDALRARKVAEKMEKGAGRYSVDVRHIAYQGKTLPFPLV